jgi:predicted permease
MKDVAYALRQVTRRPAVSAVVITMLALGIGSTTAMFSLFEAFLLRPLPVADSERLVNLNAPGPKPGSTSIGYAGEYDAVFSYPMFRDLEAQQSVFTGLAAHSTFDANLSYEGRSVAGAGVLISGNYFRVLGLEPAVGRLIGVQDESPAGDAAVAVLSHDYWQTAFGADPNVAGRSLIVNGRSLRIVGVAPAGFSGTTVASWPQVFVPIALRWLMDPARVADEHDRRSYWVYLFARLREGVTREQASAALNGIYGGIVNEIEVPLNASLPPDELAQFRAKQITLEQGSRGQSVVPAYTGLPLTLLLGMTALVLLIVCTNVASLLLARGASRTGEMAIRASLGAGRGRLTRQLFLESATLAILGGLCSLPVAAITLAGINAALPAAPGTGVEMRLNAGVMLFAAGITLSSVIMFGLAPALRLTRNLGSVVRLQAQAVSGRGASRVRAALVTAQIAFSMVLLVLAGLFATSLMNVGRTNLGIEVDSIATFSVSPQRNGYSSDRSAEIYERIEQELLRQPNVAAVTAARVPLVGGVVARSVVTIPGFEDESAGIDRAVAFNEVGRDFFRVSSIPLLSGRVFSDADTQGASRVAVVNEAFLRKFGLARDAIGTRFGTGEGAGGNEIEIVGVVADAKYSSIREDAPPQYFLPRSQNDQIGTLFFYVQSRLGVDELLPAIRPVVAGVDPNLPVTDLMTMQTAVGASLFFDRLLAVLSGLFAMLATLLAAVGLFGVLAYMVSLRTRELGLRLALGATPRQLRAIVLKQVAILLSLGLPLGFGVALLLGRVAEGVLYGLSGNEPAVFAAAVLVVVAVGLAAGYLPARQASSVAPMESLRFE